MSVACTLRVLLLSPVTGVSQGPVNCSTRPFLSLIFATLRTYFLAGSSSYATFTSTCNFISCTLAFFFSFFSSHPHRSWFCMIASTWRIKWCLIDGYLHSLALSWPHLSSPFLSSPLLSSRYRIISTLLVKYRLINGTSKRCSRAAAHQLAAHFTGIRLIDLCTVRITE